MKHILFLMPAMLNGGAEKVLIDILRNFEYSKYDVTLLLEAEDGPYIDDIPKQVRLISFHKKSLWVERLYRYLSMCGCKGLAYFFLCKLPLLWYLRGMHYDIIISFMEGMAVKMHSYVFDKADRNISWVHIDLKKKHWSLDFFKNENEELECYQRMDNIVFVSQDARIKFQELFHLDESKLEVIYNLIDCNSINDLSRQKKIGKTKFTICMVGRLNQQKRYDRAFEVVRKLKDNGYDFELWVLGSGELETELKEMVETKNINDIVNFKGFVKPVYPYMKKADIFLNTSESEGYPLTLCEALCLGLPIVATNITGSNEILINSKAGILVEEDTVSIYNGLKQMIDNKSFREECSTNAVVFSKTFSVQETMQRIYDLI